MKIEIDDDAIKDLAFQLWAHLYYAGAEPRDLNLWTALAIETKLAARGGPPFGLDRLNPSEMAAYLGIADEIVSNRTKRQHFGLPEPFAIGHRLYWRRSELDEWIEAQRPLQGAGVCDD
ncbi:MAG: helix-turn-helix domain-containing protein [Methylovirgula sp.]|nr:helix-turn-helix domain-containing protein [Methylovirgula sp.]